MLLDGSIGTLDVISSSQAILIRSAVAGAFKVNFLESPRSTRADRMASLTAKKTDAAKNKGGSPTALEENTALGLGAPRSKETLNSEGMSPNPGIL